MARKRDAKAKAYDPGDRIILDISQAEARIMVLIFNQIGGCPFSSPRKHCDALKKALLKIDRTLDDSNFKQWGKCGSDGLYFYRNTGIELNWPKPADVPKEI